MIQCLNGFFNCTYFCHESKHDPMCVQEDKLLGSKMHGEQLFIYIILIK